jgi:hypothetical protein
MAAYTDADKIMDVDTLIAHVKKLGGYVEEETNNPQEKPVAMPEASKYATSTSVPTKN